MQKSHAKVYKKFFPTISIYS